MLLMIDNYDSFTYNLVQYFAELGQDVAVYRNDEISVEQVRVLSPEYIVIGPGSRRGERHYSHICRENPNVGRLLGASMYGARLRWKSATCAYCHAWQDGFCFSYR